MINRYRSPLCAALLSFGFASAIAAADKETSIAYAYPAGARRGTTVEVQVAGQNLSGATVAIFTGSAASGAGVKAEVLGYMGSNGPLTRVQMENLREYLKARGDPASKMTPPEVPELPDIEPLRDLPGKNQAELKVISDLFTNREKMAKPPMNETVTLSVTVDADAQPGNRELRLLTPRGLTNPIIFQIGTMAETGERGSYQIPEAGHRRIDSLPAVCNGQIMPGEVDVWDVDLKKGQNLVIASQARNLIPYLADAVPGFFQPIVSVADAKGTELAVADDHGSDPDPDLAFTADADGTYSIIFRDAIWRGRYDFIYRLYVGTRAEVAEALPLPSRLGLGLPGGAEAKKGTASPEKTIAPGKSVSGLIGSKGEADSFAFQGKEGDAVSSRVTARTAGSPLDSVLTLLDSKGTVLASNDDFTDKRNGLYAHQADSRLFAKLPATGEYRLQVRDAANLGGSDYFYSLLLDRANPDFQAMSEKSALNIRAGESAELPVQVQRFDGWTGDIELFVDSAPDGWSVSNGTIPAGKDGGTVKITASPNAKPGVTDLKISARAMVDGKERIHAVQAADLEMEAFGNTHFVPAMALMTCVLPAAKKK